MITVFSPDHVLHNPGTELYGGRLVRPHESPERAGLILDRVRSVGLGDVIVPQGFGLDPVLRVHDAQFVQFLEAAWPEWRAAGFLGDAIPNCWPARRMAEKVPAHIDGKLGYYSFAAETSIAAGSWEAALVGKDVALTAAQLVHDGAKAAFGLCRPPGHHAASDLYGGYCFLNNAAVAAQWLRDQGASRIAILDIDFHHGNGTQDIFYRRADVLYASLHGDPAEAFPYFSGYADEDGAGEGEGFNINYPMSPGTAFPRWAFALERALRRISVFSPDALVVSLGVDTFENDPISFFKLTSEDFRTCGSMIGCTRIPTLFLLEGGYAIDAIGINVVNVLSGFEDG
jgi:acetoin utilization deacetylase AcuC-like enzyme